MEKGFICAGVEVQQMQLNAETEVCDATRANPPVAPSLEPPAPRGDPNLWGHPNLRLGSRMVWDAGDNALGMGTAAVPG